MRISDWSSDVCSSDLCLHARCNGKVQKRTVLRRSDFIDIEFMPVQRDGGETDISQKADRDGRNRRADGTEFRNFEIQCIRKRSGTNSGIPEHSDRSIKYNECCCVCLCRSREGGSRNTDRKSTRLSSSH